MLTSYCQHCGWGIFASHAGGRAVPCRDYLHDRSQVNSSRSREVLLRRVYSLVVVIRTHVLNSRAKEWWAPPDPVLDAALVSIDTVLLEGLWKPDAGGQYFVGTGVCSAFLLDRSPLWKPRVECKELMFEPLCWVVLGMKALLGKREDIEGWLEPTSRRTGVQYLGTEYLIPN